MLCFFQNRQRSQKSHSTGGKGHRSVAGGGGELGLVHGRMAEEDGTGLRPLKKVNCVMENVVIDS